MVRVFSLSVVLILLATLLPGCQSAADALAAPGHARIARNSPAGANLAQDPLDEFVYLPLVLRGMTMVFVADRTSITQGQCVTFSWNVQGATTVYFDGSLVEATGTSIRCPLVTTIYGLSAVDAQSNLLTAAITITVTPGY
jgi:hypothetical protein